VDKRLLTFFCALLVASGAVAAGDWARTWSEVRTSSAVYDSFEYQTTGATTSEDLDARRCTGATAVKFDPSINDNSTNAVGSIYNCPSNGAALGSCTQLTTLSGANARWEEGFDATRGLGVGAPPAFLRVVFTTAPTGGDIASVHVECLEAPATLPAEERVLFDSYNHTLIDFQHLSDTACANAMCTPNDALTPTWIRQAIGAVAGETFTLDSTYAVSGQAILDPGTAANTGVQLALPATQSLVLDQAATGRFEQRRYAFRVSFWRSGTTVIPAFGLCPTNASNATTNMLTTGGAANSPNTFSIVWNANGSFTLENGSSDITTAQTYGNGYHELTIRSVRRNIGLDLTGLHLPSGSVADSVVVEIDGVAQQTVAFSGMPIDVSTLQMVPCVAAVNVGGTTDSLHLVDLEWHMPKQHAIPDAN
jgi:hypothetical protein